MDTRERKERGPWSRTRFSMSTENERAGRGTGRSNLSRGTKFSGADGDREKLISLVSFDHEQDW